MEWRADPTHPDRYIAEEGRFRCMTWPFGTIHQTKIFIKYEHSEREYAQMPGYVSVGVAPGKTREEAQKRMEEWASIYKPTEAEEIIAKSLKDYSDIHPDRESVLEHMFLRCGCGYEWLDGGLIDHDQEPAVDYSHLKELATELDQAVAKAHELLGKEVPPEPEPEPNPPPTLRGGGTNIERIPRDLRPDWALVALEAAILLKTKGATEKDRQAGAEFEAALRSRGG